MKKLIITIVLAICSFKVSFGQDIDQKTLNKFAVKLMTMENMYNEGKYREVIEKANEIEALVAGFESEKAQNLKVKAYLGLEMYERAKTELDKLYNMRSNEEVLADIATYEDKIVKNIWDVEKIKERKESTSNMQGEARSIFANKKYGEDNNVKEKYALFNEYIYLASCPTHDFCDFRVFGAAEYIDDRGKPYANMFLYHNITPIWQEINMISPSDVEKVTLSRIDEGFKIRIFASRYEYKKQKKYASYDDNEWEDKNINFSVNCSSIEDARIVFGAIRSCLELSKPGIIYEDQTK